MRKEQGSSSRRGGGRKVSREEFRLALEKEMPKEVDVQCRHMDDYGPWGELSFKRADGERVYVVDYYPTTDAEGNVRIPNMSPVSVLDNLPYKWTVFPDEWSAVDAQGRLVRR